MTAKFLRVALLLSSFAWTFGTLKAETNSVRALIEAGNADLSRNRLHEAAQNFQKAVDLDPSSAKAHEGLGVALFKELLAGKVRPSADSDVFERAESHLKQASDLAPSSAAPLIQWAALEASIAEHSTDADERSDRYKKATDLLRQALGLKPGNAALYLRLASLERDEFGPALQQAEARFGKNNGPIPEPGLRHALQQQYGSLIDNAIANAKQASALNANATGPLLLTARLLQQRALIRDTQEQYAADMHSAEDWKRQFLISGGHIGQEADAHP